MLVLRFYKMYDFQICVFGGSRPGIIVFFYIQLLIVLFSNPYAPVFVFFCFFFFAKEKGTFSILRGTNQTSVSGCFYDNKSHTLHITAIFHGWNVDLSCFLTFFQPLVFIYFTMRPSSAYIVKVAE